ncbi:DsbA family oxidoreductase [Maricaulis sp.]|uniref:DsbA family oxidoreductase n=1 Tax=Maricaulis sp. TaxID=1486257 RepID=UPI003A9270E6
MTHPVSIDIVADLVCPWCWLGKRNWDAACKLVPEIPVETFWRPYQLDPDLPRSGRPYREYMKAKFSGANTERWTQMRTYLEEAAPAAGIEFRFDDIPVRPNTLNAHRILRWAGGQGVADAAAEGLFRAFFAESEDIGDPAVLARIAGAAGLDATLTAELLASDRDEAEIRAEEAFFRKLGISGVPAYIFNGRFAVSGAQEPQVLADAIRQAAQEPAETD